MGTGRLQRVLAVCGAGLVLTLAAQDARAASEHEASSTSAKAGTPSPAHRTRPAPHKATIHTDHKKALEARPAATVPLRPGDKSPERRALVDRFSVGVETDPNVKPRSIAGGEFDFDREPGVRSNYGPLYFGLSLKSPFSW